MGWEPIDADVIAVLAGAIGLGNLVAFAWIGNTRGEKDDRFITME